MWILQLLITFGVLFTRMATVSKDGTWKFWDIDGNERPLKRKRLMCM